MSTAYKHTLFWKNYLKYKKTQRIKKKTYFHYSEFTAVLWHGLFRETIPSYINSSLYMLHNRILYFTELTHTEINSPGGITNRL